MVATIACGASPTLAETGSSQPTLAENRSSQPKERPNLLFISIDDLRPSLGCYGDPLAKSPQLDRFAKSARQFNRAYVQQAVCGPSRASVLTGRLPDYTRVWHNRNRFRDTRPNLITMPQLFKQNGYRTTAIGKVFSGNQKELDSISWSDPEVVTQKGWRRYLLPENQGKANKQAAHESPDVADEAYPDGKLANLAIETLEQRVQSDQPWFLAVGFFKPHLPFNAPRQYWDLHDADSFDLADQVRWSIQGAPKLAQHSHRELGGYRDVPQNEQLDAAQTRRLRHGYYACVSYVDAQVGKLLDALDRLELRQDTIVVIWGDHGFALGETNRWCKGTNFELDTHVPLLIRTPNLPQPGTATDALVELVDLYPTLAALAGLVAPKNLDGHNLVPLLDNPQAAGRDAVLSQFNRPWSRTTPETMGYSIRTPSQRYTRWIDWQTRQTVSEELYDYASAPSQRRSGQLVEHANIVDGEPQLLDQMRTQMSVLLEQRTTKQ